MIKKIGIVICLSVQLQVQVKVQVQVQVQETNKESSKSSPQNSCGWKEVMPIRQICLNIAFISVVFTFTLGSVAMIEYNKRNTLENDHIISMRLNDSHKR